MTPEQHARIREVFLEVCGRSPADQAAFLAKRCADDPFLRAEVERLLAHHHEGTLGIDAVDPQPLAVDPSDAPTRPMPDVPTVAGAEPEPDLGLCPGHLLAERYRIVAPLGRGGMGEVYRVDDLRLKQTVALKFLLPSLTVSPMWVARFHQEVRLAREITHPNVCRVFDAGEADGLHFLSMEYVDGENLAVLLKRLGRLQHDKAVDIARQICAGLAAAHARGVLHRDLKPANIMIDGRGQVRLTDFGLAGAAADIRGLEIRAGTPAYMAPEQISGREVTVRSDIYSLGLVLFELFAGQPVFRARTVADYAALHCNSRPPLPSDVAEDLEPDVERVILQCLEKDPKRRPPSALAVAAALPGSDLLADALAAHQTPTPEMLQLAAVPQVRLPHPAWVAIAFVALGLALLQVRALAPLPWDLATDRPPAVLAATARQVAEQSGFHLNPGGFAMGFCDVADISPAAFGLDGWGHSERRIGSAHDGELLFWYRQGPTGLVPNDFVNILFGSARVTFNDPPQAAPGMLTAVLTLDGQLRFLASVPEPTAGTAPGFSPDLLRDQLFMMAGLDAAAATEVPVQVASIYRSMSAQAWSTAPAAGGTTTVHVELHASAGRPTVFLVSGARQVPAVMFGRQLRKEVVTLFWAALATVLLGLVALPWAWRNYRAGRSDRDGAIRLAAAVLVIRLVSWALESTHTARLPLEIMLVCAACFRALATACLIWLFYVALEPYARRFWPEMLISWRRLLALRWRDAAVGRHVVLGVGVGLFWAVLFCSERAVVGALGWPVRPVLADSGQLELLLGGRLPVAGCLSLLLRALFRGLLLVLLLAGLRALFRRPVWAILAVLVLAPAFLPRGAHSATSWLVVGLGGVALGLWLMVRFGLVAFAVATFVSGVLISFPMRFGARLWTSDLSLMALAIVAGLVVVGYALARAPRPQSRIRAAPGP